MDAPNPCLVVANEGGLVSVEIRVASALGCPHVECDVEVVPLEGCVASAAARRQQGDVLVGLHEESAPYWDGRHKVQPHQPPEGQPLLPFPLDVAVQVEVVGNDPSYMVSTFVVDVAFRIRRDAGALCIHQVQIQSAGLPPAAGNHYHAVKTFDEVAAIVFVGEVALQHPLGVSSPSHLLAHSQPRLKDAVKSCDSNN